MPQRGRLRWLAVIGVVAYGLCGCGPAPLTATLPEAAAFQIQDDDDVILYRPQVRRLQPVVPQVARPVLARPGLATWDDDDDGPGYVMYGYPYGPIQGLGFGDDDFDDLFEFDD